MSERAIDVSSELPARVLLCLHPECYGAFYLPLDLDEAICCPVDRAHDVAIYGSPCIHGGDDG